MSFNFSNSIYLIRSLKSVEWSKIFTLGKRPLVRRRGRGNMQYRVSATGKIAPAKYPSFELSENHEGEIIDLVH